MVSKEQDSTERMEQYGQDSTTTTHFGLTFADIGEALANDHADKEQLDDLMGGQSHRARLNKEIREQGGQEYGKSSSVEIDDYPRRGRGGGCTGRGMLGRSGRGAPMQ
jgi:hypothetical protein